MALTRAKKQKTIEELKEKVGRQKAIVFVDFTGVKVKDLTILRRRMKEQDCELKVVKKTLMQLVLKENGIEIDKDKLQGEVALGFGYKDEILPFKILFDFSRESENLKIIGGFIGKEFIEKEKAIELAQLPTREELLTRLVFIIKSPLSGFYNVLQGSLKNFINILSQLQKVKT